MRLKTSLISRQRALLLSALAPPHSSIFLLPSQAILLSETPLEATLLECVGYPLFENHEVPGTKSHDKQITRHSARPSLKLPSSSSSCSPILSRSIRAGPLSMQFSNGDHRDKSNRPIHPLRDTRCCYKPPNLARTVGVMEWAILALRPSQQRF